MHLAAKPLTTAQVLDLIRELASMYVTRPERLETNVQESTDGAAYFSVRGLVDDDSRLVGREGCHVNALTFLVDQVGKAQGRLFTFRLLTTPGGCTPWNALRDAIEYDPLPAHDLLVRWLWALGVEDFSVEVNAGAGPRRILLFNFEVKIADRGTAEDLTAPVGDRDLSVVGALGTLFRAIAKQAGVRFQIRLVDP